MEETPIWYVADEDTALGPFTKVEVAEQLRTGKITMATLVLRNAWTPLAQFSEFKQTPEKAPVSRATFPTLAQLSRSSLPPNKYSELSVERLRFEHDRRQSQLAELRNEFDEAERGTQEALAEAWTPDIRGMIMKNCRDHERIVQQKIDLLEADISLVEAALTAKL